MNGQKMLSMTTVPSQGWTRCQWVCCTQRAQALQGSEDAFTGSEQCRHKISHLSVFVFPYLK